MSLIRIQDPASFIPTGGEPFIPCSVRHPIGLIGRMQPLPNLAARAELILTLLQQASTSSFVEINGLRFTFANGPTASQLPWLGTPVSAVVLPALSASANVLSAFMNALLASPLNQDYLIERVGPLQIKLTARRAGTQSNITCTAASTWLVANTSGGSPFVGDNLRRLRMRVRVFVDQSPPQQIDRFGPGYTAQVDDWQEVADLERAFDPEFSEFDIADVLRPYVRPQAPVFTNFKSQWLKWAYVQGAARRWAYEAYADYVDEHNVRVLRFGFGRGREADQYGLWVVRWRTNPYFSEAEAAEAIRDYWAMWLSTPNTPGDQQARWLTQQPARKRIDRRSIEYLDLHKGLPSGYMHLRITYQFADGSSVSQFVPEFTKEVVGSGIVRIEVSPRVFEDYATTFSPYSGLPPVGYSVQAYWSAGGNPSVAVPVTTEQHYDVSEDGSCDDRFYQLMFMNALGGFDTVWLGSRVEMEAKRDAPVAVRLRQPEEQRSNADGFQVVQRGRMQGRASTGYLTARECDWLQSLAVSDEVYLLDYDSALGGFNYRLISVDDLQLSVNEFRETGPESLCLINFTYLIDL